MSGANLANGDVTNFAKSKLPMEIFLNKKNDDFNWCTPGVCNRLVPFSDVLAIFSWPHFGRSGVKLIPLALVRYWYCDVGAWTNKIFENWISCFYLTRNFFLHIWYIIFLTKIQVIDDLIFRFWVIYILKVQIFLIKTSYDMPYPLRNLTRAISIIMRIIVDESSCMVEIVYCTVGLWPSISP